MQIKNKTIKISGKTELIYIIFTIVVFVFMLMNMSEQRKMNINIDTSNLHVVDTSGEWTYYQPDIELRKGSYVCSLSTANARSGAQVGIFDINTGEPVAKEPILNGQTELHFDLSKGVNSLRVAVLGAADISGVYIESGNLLNTDAVFGAIMFLLFAAAIYLIRFSALSDNKEYKTAFLLTMLGLSVSATSFMTASYGHDMPFHINRISNITAGILNGQIPVRNYELYNSGYGSITGIMYPDLFLYIPAVLKLFGVSSSCAYGAFTAMINIASAFTAYYSVKTITKSSYASVMSAVVYTTSLWRLENIVLRAAVGEAIAMVFFPVVIAGIYHILKGDKKKWYILAIGMIGLINSHILSVFVAFVFCAVMCCVFYKDTIKKETLTALAKAVGITLALTLWFLVPFMSMSSEELFITHTNTSFLGPTLQILPAQLFNVLNEGTGITNNMPIGNQMGKSLGIGTTILIFVSAAYFLFRKNKKIKDEKFILVLFFAGLTALWMATTYFPWTLLYKIPIIEHAVGKMQYSWRFLSIVSAIICITGSAVIAYFCRTRIHKILSVILMLLICFIGIANFYSNYMKIATVFEKNTCPWIVTLDYSYVNVDVNQLKANQYESDAFDVVDAKKKGAKIDMTVSPKSAASGGQVKVPLSYYPGFTVKDKDNHTLEYTKSDNGVLAVELPAGYSGEVKIRYTGMLLWHFTDVFSLLSLAAVLVYIKTGGKIIRRT